MRCVVRKVAVDQSWRLRRPGGGQAERSRDVRPVDERVPGVSDQPAEKSTRMMQYKYRRIIVGWKEGTYALQVTGMCQRDSQVSRGHPGRGFRPPRAGEQGRSLPPPAPPASLSLFRFSDRLRDGVTGTQSLAGEADDNTVPREQ